MLEIQAEVSYLQKDKSSSALKYSYVSHDKVTETLRPYFLKHGVYYYVTQTSCQHEQLSDRNGNPVVFTTVGIDITFIDSDSGEQITCSGYGTGLDPSDKSVGKAISYAVKYVLLKTLGLATGDDPEQDQIEIGDKHGNDVRRDVRNGSAAKSSSGGTPPATDNAPSSFIEGKQQRYIWAWGTGSSETGGLGLRKEDIEDVLRSMGFIDRSTGRPKISIVPLAQFDDLKNRLVLKASK